MVAAYVYFSPVSGVAEVVAAGSSAGARSRPFAKPVPPKPIVGRLTQSPGPIRIGIIAGHKGNDSGAVCADGLTEVEVNENIAVRVVSMPCTQVFDAQPIEWREGVLPSWCRARIAVEAGVSDFWRKDVGLDGALFGLDSFGASAPAERLLSLIPV